MRLFWAALLAAHAAWGQTPLYQNADAPLEKRVDDLVGRLTLDEKIAMLGQMTPAIPRLEIVDFTLLTLTLGLD